MGHKGEVAKEVIGELVEPWEGLAMQDDAYLNGLSKTGKVIESSNGFIKCPSGLDNKIMEVGMIGIEWNSPDYLGMSNLFEWGSKVLVAKHSAIREYVQSCMR
jgi:hypothetical protein